MNEPEEAVIPTPLPPKIFERLFQSRFVLVHGEVDSRLAQQVTAQLLALAAAGEDPITIFIHSEGGHVEAGDSIHDIVRFVKPKVRMVGTGWVASAGTHIYLAAPKKDRFCLPNTRFMIHQPLGGIGGRATDIRIEAEEILKVRERLNALIAAETGQSVERVAKDSDRNFWMDAGQAREYGLVSRVIVRTTEIA
jgi:ATP-dependent Clp protease protease subunit